MATGYSFDASWEGERARLGRIESWLDPHSIRAFEERGVQPGWRCLDVGAGGGSLTQWLCERVGPRGSVLAVDADTRFVEKLGAANLEVRRADVVHEPLPEGTEGIVYADLDLGMISLAKAAADPAGHYARPDVTRLLLDRTPGDRVVMRQRAPAEVKRGSEDEPVLPRAETVADTVVRRVA